MLTRKDFLLSSLASFVAMKVPVQAGGGTAPQEDPNAISLEDMKAMEKVIGLELTDEERRAVLVQVRALRAGVENVRKLPIDYLVEPATVFETLPARSRSQKSGKSVKVNETRGLKLPSSKDDIAFLTVRELSQLVRTKQVSPVELTDIYLERLQTYGTKLLAVVTLLDDFARAEAKQAEKDIMAGRYRGPLHGIPCGIKDLFAMKGVKTTWGAEPYKEQVFDYDSAVVERLRAAGAIICAKLSMGALAQGDVWYAGRTNNPWNTQQGSSGSSAGSGATVAAGLVAFAIGTETLGSIMSPSHQNRVTGLRPTYGRVSRYGAMAVSWTMDKIGPICRHADDCALVFAAITGADPRDRSTVDAPFHYEPKIDLKKLRIAYVQQMRDGQPVADQVQTTDYLSMLAKEGIKIEPVTFTPVPQGVGAVLGIEAAAAFDEFTRSDKIDLLKNSAWPNTYRSNRYVSAVDYLQAQRARTQLMYQFEKELKDYDVVLANGNGGNTLFTTNLTGHPQVLVPNGADERGNSRSVSLVGRLHEEDTLLKVAREIQERLGHYRKRPDLTKI